MKQYKRIAVAVDLSRESNQVLDQAVSVCAAQAEISLIHVVEPIASPYITTIPPVQPAGYDLTLMENFKQAAEKQLIELSDEYDRPNLTMHVLTGSPPKEIRRFAKENSCDLIVIGTHGQHGFELILGSTANAVLHGAPCDVLSVRVDLGAEEED